MLLLTGCAVGPKYQRPPVEVPAAYKEGGNWKAAQPNEQSLGGNCWEIFQDPQLNALEQQVDISNQNLKAAQARYMQARALLRYYRADYFPTVAAAPSATRARVSSNRPPPRAISNGVTSTDLQLPFELSYEIDAWGRVRRNVEFYREQAQASAADLATVNLSVHAQLALFYFQARSLDAQEQLLNSTVALYEQALELNQSRFQGGIGSEVEVQQAKTQLETTRAQAIDVGVLRAQFEHAVATLIGKPAGSFSLPPLPLRTPPPPIAAYDQTVASYRETVLTSFQQVEDNLAALRILEKEAQTQNEAVVAAQKYLELSITRYKGGVTSYLEVTTAQSAALADEVTAVNLLRRRMVASG